MNSGARTWVGWETVARSSSSGNNCDTGDVSVSEYCCDGNEVGVAEWSADESKWSVSDSSGRKAGYVVGENGATTMSEV